MATVLPAQLALNGSDRRKSHDEQRLLDRLDALGREGKEVRDRNAPKQQIERDKKLYRGEVGPKRNADQVYFTANFIQAFVERMCAQMTDNRPTIRIDPRKRGLFNVAKVATKVIQATWEDAEMQRQTYKMCLSAAVTRSAGLYTGYDPISGDIVLERLKLDQVTIDPVVDEAGKIRDAQYLSIERIKPLDEVKYRFPGRAADLKPDVVMVDQDKVTKSRQMFSPLLDAFRNTAMSGDALERVMVTEWLIVDHQRGPDGNPMFPTGRQILRTRDRILWDGPLVYWDGAWPVDWYDWIVDPDHPYGRSAPDLLMRLQLSLNQLMDGVVENHILTNIMTMLFDWDAFDEPTVKKLQNLSNSLLLRKRNRNASATLTPPPPFGADKVALARFIITIMQLLTGVTDVTMGESPGSLQSGQAIEGLQEGANLMTRSRASRLEDFFKRVGEKLLARIFQFRTADEVVSLVGPSGESVDYAIKRQEFFTDDDGKSLLGEGNWEEAVERRKQVFRDMRFIVVPGSSAPGSRVNRGKMALNLYVAGLLPGEDVLQAIDYPDAEARYAKASQQAAQRDPNMMTKLKGLLGSNA